MYNGGCQHVMGGACFQVFQVLPKTYILPVHRMCLSQRQNIQRKEEEEEDKFVHVIFYFFSALVVQRDYCVFFLICI